MRETIIRQTKQRIKILLDKKQERKNLQKLKRARYMRQAYLKQKKRVNLTFDRSDFEKIQKEAETVDTTPTAFLRDATLAYLKNCRVPTNATEQQFSELVFLLRNMANNLNQIARQANTIQKLSFRDFLTTKSILQNLEDTAEAFMKKL